jgi:hypothetical protein
MEWLLLFLVISAQPPLEPSWVVLRRKSFGTHILGWYEEAMALESVFMEQVDHGFSLLYDI